MQQNTHGTSAGRVMLIGENPPGGTPAPGPPWSPGGPSNPPGGPPAPTAVKLALLLPPISLNRTSGVLRLPVRPQPVEPGVVHEEDGVAGAGDGVGHLWRCQRPLISRYLPLPGRTHLGPDPAVARRVRPALEARPKLHEPRHVHAPLDIRGRRRRARPVVDQPVDAVVLDGVARAERVGVVGEGPVLDAVGGADAVAAEAQDGVEQGRGAEVAGVELLFPVTNWDRRGVRRLFPGCGGGEGERDGTYGWAPV